MDMPYPGSPDNLALIFCHKSQITSFLTEMLRIMPQFR